MSHAVETQISVSPELALEATVLQTIAHEIRQPLSAIESIACYIGMVLPHGEERARECLAKLQKLVEQANWILDSGLQLADSAPLDPEPVQLNQIFTELVRERLQLGGLRPRLDLDPDLRPVDLDRRRARALVDNLLGLFVQLATDDHPLCIRTWGSGSVQFELSTTAPGYKSEMDLGAGCGLCIQSVRQIVEAHEGRMGINVHPATGIRLRVVLP